MKERLKQRTRHIGYLFVVIFGLLGIAALVTTQAATYVGTAEAEGGRLTGGAKPVSDANASGQYAVKFAPAQPAPTSQLRWAPPALTNPTTINVPEGLADYQVYMTAGKDYIVNLPDTTRGGIMLRGGHNVVIIGGSISAANTTGTKDPRGIYVQGQTGTVHIEGVQITGQPGIEFDAIAVNAPQAIVQIQNFRAMGIRGTFSGNHGDIVQPWGGARALRIDKLTGTTSYQGLFLIAAANSIGSIELQRIDIAYDRAYTGPIDGGGHLIAVALNGKPAAPSITIKDAYLTAFRNIYNLGTSVFPNINDPTFPAQVSNDFVTWPKLTQVSGGVRGAIPPQGNFVPAGSAGTDYSSPGYGP